MKKTVIIMTLIVGFVFTMALADLNEFLEQCPLCEKFHDIQQMILAGDLVICLDCKNMLDKLEK